MCAYLMAGTRVCEIHLHLNLSFLCMLCGFVFLINVSIINEC